MTDKSNVQSALILALLVFLAGSHRPAFGQTGQEAVLPIKRTSDFSLDGKGTAEAWRKAEWIPITQRATTERMARNPAPRPAAEKPPAELATRAKVLYSETGIYFLFRCEDRMLQATMEEDFKEVWWEDVVEVFLWPDESDSTYFEYQLSPLNYYRMTRHQKGPSQSQLVTLGGSRRTLHATSVKGGDKESGTSITQWTAEIFIPYEMLRPIQNIPPEPGTQWRANMYRFDYDTGDRTRWEWQPVNGRNHDLGEFGTFLFQ